MTLVVNRLQQLNGNKAYIAVFLMALLLSSCNFGASKNTRTRTTKKPTRTSPSKPKSVDKPTKPQVKTIPVDTVEWVEVDMFEDESSNGLKKESYDISIFIPFENSSNLTEDRFTNYYAGVKMALSDLEEDGASFNVTVFNASSGDISSKLRKASSSDVIIGPYAKKDLIETAELCKENNIVHVSPWLASKSITSNNPNYIQLRPNLSDYYTKLTEHALMNYAPEDIYILKKEGAKPSKSTAFIQDVAAATLNQNTEDPFMEHAVNIDSLISPDHFAFRDVIDSLETTVFILPNYSSRDDDYIYNVIRKLSIEKQKGEVVLYGMERILDSDNVEFEYFRNIDIKVCRHKFVNVIDRYVNSFKKLYFDKYSGLPTDDAYDGYDMMYYIGSNLWDHGTAFQHELYKDQNRYLQVKYNVDKVYDTEDGTDDSFSKINYFINKHLDIVEFKDDQFYISN